MISFVISAGDDFDKAFVGTHFTQYLSTGQVLECENSHVKYIKFLESLNPKAGISYNFVSDNPKSVFHTVTVVSNLLDLHEEDNLITEQLIDYLLDSQQGNGQWKDLPSLKSLPNLPVWSDPSNTSVSIFNTCSVAATLSRIQSYDIQGSLNRALEYLEQMKYENGSIFGFPQSTWIITPALARMYGLSNSRFLLQWSILNDFVNASQTTGNLTTIARGLINSNIEPEDTLLQNTDGLIRERYLDDGKFGGWKNTSDQFDAKISLGSLYTLQYASEI